MVKYRGKSDGRKRGPYSSAIVEGVVEVPIDKYDLPSDFFLGEVDPYLIRAGKKLFLSEDGRSVDAFYHFGGASLYAHYRPCGYEVAGEEEGDQYLLRFLISTNDSPADVVRKLKRRFPFVSGPKQKSEFG